LFPRSPVFLRKRGLSAADSQHEGEEDAMLSHVRVLFILDVDGRAVPRGDAASNLQMNAANERSRRQENVKLMTRGSAIPSS
jgi:hypothetical protein